MTPKPKKPSPRTKKNSRPWITDEGIKRLRQVKKLILTSPALYDQSHWCCGTTMCIAGHAAMMANPDLELGCPNSFFSPRSLAPYNEDGVPDPGMWRTLGQEALGIAGDYVDRLFGPPDVWPRPFCDAYYWAGSHADRAKVAARRIEHFIKTGK